MRPQHHEQLEVWQSSIELAIETHHLVATFGLENRIAYGDQLRRAAVSVAANIAEGAARRHRREYLQFVSVARASLAELHTLLTIAERLSLADEKHFSRMTALVSSIARMLTNLAKAVHRLAEKNW